MSTNSGTTTAVTPVPTSAARRPFLLAARVGPLRGGGLWGSIGVIFAYLAISIPQYGAPYVIDEAVFPYVAAGILKNGGAPYFYNGLLNPHELGLWHPPLYEYLLAGQIGIWGMSPSAVRSFGAICVIASFFLIALALRRIAPEMRQSGYVVLAALFLLNPLVISDALVPDIDGTLGLFVVSMAIWVATVVAQSAITWRLTLGLVGFAVLCVSTKFEIAAIAALFVGGAALVSRVHRWRKLLWAAASFLVGAAVSLGLLFSLGAILKFDAHLPFDYLFASLGTRAPGRGGFAGAIVDLLSGPMSNVVWIGPTIIASAIAAAIVVLVLRPRNVSRSLAVLTLVGSLLVLWGYSYITGSPFDFPKYTAVVVPGLAIVTSLLLVFRPAAASNAPKRARSTNWILGIAYALLVVAGGTATFILASRYESSRARALHELFLLAVADFAGVLIVTVVFVYLLRYEPTGSLPSRLRSPIAIGLLAATVLAPIMVQTGSSLVNATSPFSTRYYYRESGMSEFLVEAARIIPPGTPVIAAKDVGLQLPRPFYEDASFLPLPPARLRAKLESLQVPYLITRNSYDYSESAFPKQFAVLREFYKPILAKSDSDFVLWKLK